MKNITTLTGTTRHGDWSPIVVPTVAAVQGGLCLEPTRRRTDGGSAPIFQDSSATGAYAPVMGHRTWSPPIT